MRSLNTARRQSEAREGTAVVETAVVMAFVLIPVLLGIIEFGRMMMVGQIVTTGARYGVRQAILDGSSNQEITDLVTEYITGSLGLAPDIVTVVNEVEAFGTNPPVSDFSTARRRDLCRVTVSVRWDDVAFITGRYLTGKRIEAQAAMRHE